MVSFDDFLDKVLVGPTTSPIRLSQASTTLCVITSCVPEFLDVMRVASGDFARKTGVEVRIKTTPEGHYELFAVPVTDHARPYSFAAWADFPIIPAGEELCVPEVTFRGITLRIGQTLQWKPPGESPVSVTVNAIRLNPTPRIWDDHLGEWLLLSACYLI